MRTALRLGLGLAVSAACATAAHAQWDRTEFAEYGFSARFPAPPKEEIQEIDGLTMHSWVGLGAQAACVVLHADYGGPVEPEAELVASRDNYVAGLKDGRLDSSKRITVARGGAQKPALEADASTPAFRSRVIFVVDGTEVMSVSGLVMRDHADAERFLEDCVRGFKLTPRS